MADPLKVIVDRAREQFPQHAFLRTDSYHARWFAMFVWRLERGFIAIKDEAVEELIDHVADYASKHQKLEESHFGETIS